MAITRRPPGVRPLGSFGHPEDEPAAPPRSDARHAPADERAPPPRPGTSGDAAYSVSDLVGGIDRLVSRVDTYGDIWVKGELAEFYAHGGGHWYFTLKDANAQIKAVMWAGVNRSVPFTPENGLELLCRGRVSVYTNRGALQIQITEMQPAGLGSLALQFEQLKKRLTAEGLFDPARKRPIPRHPRIVGVVTSRGAAALRDIVHVATRRHPGIRLLIVHAQVQGEGAAIQVAAGIARLNALRGTRDEPDIIIVGRGGGSLEDLWTFNEETTVRAVAASEIPIVCAVGHETDTSLADLAADLRAATPSAAAETVVPDVQALLRVLDDADHRLTESLQRTLPNLRQRLDELHDRTVAMMRREIDTRRERFDGLMPRLGASLTRVLPVLRQRIRATARQATRAMSAVLVDRRRRLDEAAPRIEAMMSRILVQRHERFDGLVARLNAANPLGVLERGYAAIVKDGEPVVSVAAVEVGQHVTMRFADGEADARIEAKRRTAPEDRSRSPEEPT